MSKKNKNTRGVVYSTNPDFRYDTDREEEQETLDPGNQMLKVLLDSKNRKGKVVTLVDGFVGSEEDAKDLAKTLKQYCGTGGSCKDGEILVQGDVREKVKKKLVDLGYGVK